jgi:copper chaperone CopZ
VDVRVGEKTVVVEGEGLDPGKLIEAVDKAGFKAVLK